jgi:hypothetical protein
MPKTLLCKRHVSPTHVTVIAPASGISIFTGGFDPIRSYTSAQNSCKAPCFGSFCVPLFTSRSFYVFFIFISYNCSAFSLSFSSDGYELDDQSSFRSTFKDFCLPYSAQAESMNYPIGNW